jgi:phosphomannomutase
LQNNSITELPLALIRKEYKIPLSLEEKDFFIEKLQQNKNIMLTLGGVRKSYSDGWWLIRASNTENYLLIKYEAMNELRAKNIIKELSKITNIQLSLI